MNAMTIGGPPGSGTTTIAKKLADELKWEYIYTGDIFRKLAEKYEMTLAEFGKYAQRHPEIDYELDEHQLELAKTGNIILEGRVAGWIAWKNGVDALKVWLDAELEVRAERVSRRENKDMETVLWEIKEREDSEYARYMTLYNFDLRDTSFYELVINTSPLTPDEICDLILAELGNRKGEQSDD